MRSLERRTSGEEEGLREGPGLEMWEDGWVELRHGDGFFIKQ